MAEANKPTAEEIASLRFGGTRARPRKGIEAVKVTGKTFLKPPGSCLTRWPGLGVAVEVECCADCHIYVLDPTERVQISECKNCRIVVGPCVGSLMLFDCTDCTVAIAASQVRLRDCFDCELRVFAPSSESGPPMPQVRSLVVTQRLLLFIIEMSGVVLAKKMTFAMQDALINMK